LAQFNLFDARQLGQRIRSVNLKELEFVVTVATINLVGSADLPRNRRIREEQIIVRSALECINVCSER